MNHLDLFSGIGGFALGLERAGMKTIAFCEIDEFCRKVLSKHWPNVPIFEDVRTLDADRLGRLPKPDILTAGYPCQPFSVAGKRRGEEDDRHLWPEVARLLDTVRPSWFIGENVYGHISMGLDEVLSDLEGLEYTAWPFVIPACAVDAPHRRDRVWIVAHSAQLQRDGSGEHSEQGERQVSKPGKRSRKDAVADAEQQRQPGSRTYGDASDQTTGGERQTTQLIDGGFGCQWLPEPDVGRVAHGIPNRVDRLKALGNAVVPQIPEMIGRAILHIERNGEIDADI